MQGSSQSSAKIGRQTIYELCLLLLRRKIMANLKSMRIPPHFMDREKARTNILGNTASKTIIKPWVSFFIVFISNLVLNRYFSLHWASALTLDDPHITLYKNW